MIVSFGDKLTENLFQYESLKDTRRIDIALIRKICRKLDLIHAVVYLNDLKVPPGNYLEALIGDLQGNYSIRVDQKGRIIFKWEEGSAYHVQFVDYH